ncbi:MAG: peptidyl-prolyl cis-trans isomerase, partial [Candidatus Marinimicrobia bacterium]|nr:peptidyl-prolyl cis-trans isomerase [Candidatus Neomarinimicrobiota bacterium]
DVTTQILIGLIKDPKTGWTIASLTDTSTIKNLVVNEINKKLITEYGYTNKFDNDKSMTEDLKKQERGYVWQEIKKLNIEDRIDDRDENLLKYYNEYKDNYVSKRTSDILEILVSEKTLADSLYSLAMSGGDMESLALEFSERSTAKKNNGIIEGVTSKRLGPIGKQAAMMNVGDISKPLKAGNKWSIFKILSAVPPRYIPFSEAKSRLIVDFKKEEIKRLTEEFGRYLINKYNPHYYFENINAQVATSEIE